MTESMESEHEREVRGKSWGAIGTLVVIAVGFFVLKQGTAHNEERDRRQSARGDSMHTVVEVVLPGPDGKLTMKKLSDPAVASLRDAPMLPAGPGSLRDSRGYGISWEVRALSPMSQEVTVAYVDSNRGYEFVYRNEGGRIVPVSSRQSSSSYMFDAFGWAAGAMAGTTVLLVALGMSLNRRKTTQSAAGD